MCWINLIKRQQMKPMNCGESAAYSDTIIVRIRKLFPWSNFIENLRESAPLLIKSADCYFFDLGSFCNRIEIYLKKKRVISTMIAQMSLLKVMDIRWSRQIRIFRIVDSCFFEWTRCLSPQITNTVDWLWSTRTWHSKRNCQWCSLDSISWSSHPCSVSRITSS